ncbi:hypothetical protein GCM10009810_18350 [Nostocoides vanveenii]|uniref:Uncharacterized protein n=1 Tax=Nostocoides vanveenii TaxID=330835 RepID=A0ABP4WNY1_9MICO
MGRVRRIYDAGVVSESRQRFRGQIAGFGTTSGTRIVIGRWTQSPFGAFADVMIETGDGRRLLLAPIDEVADFVASTYTFDEVRLVPVTVDATDDQWIIQSPCLRATFDLGGRTVLGRMLRALPRPLAGSPRWARLIGPIASLIVPGVRTVGTARAGRVEYYGASDNRAITRVGATLDGQQLGALAPVEPPCRFGFSSTPSRPSVTSVITTIDDAPPAARRRRLLR